MRRSHKDLMVWQESMQLAQLVYQLTARFPADERFGLVSQMRRAAVSVPSNIAEGAARQHTKELVQFLRVASGSLAELDTQTELAISLGFLQEDMNLGRRIERVTALVLALAQSLKRKMGNANQEM
ncbi:MAG: four helix bundle protein [Moraxellaceae bacterium]